MLQQFIQKYAGMSQDMTLSKTDDNKYWSANNIRISATDSPSTYSVTNEHGNEYVLSMPRPYLNAAKTQIEYEVGDDFITVSYLTNTSDLTPPRCQLEEAFYGKASQAQDIIGIAETRNGVIIATTDGFGFDCFWELEGINTSNYRLTLLYMNNLGFDKSHPLQIIYHYENSIIEKIYFVDGVHQLRFMNIRQSTEHGDLINLIDMNPSSIDTVADFKLSQPSITGVVGGGTHTSGMIQYGYSLYILNGSQTVISPLSGLVSIDKGTGLGGGAVNENLGKAVTLEIPNIDESYTHIKIYAVKYTSFNQLPEVSVIADKEIDNYNSLSYYDNGGTISNVSLAQFLFLGSNPKVPKHIATKDSRMFLINNKEQNFDMDLDMRAYGHNSGGQAKVWENLSFNGSIVIGNELNIDTSLYNVPEKHDAINRDYFTYKYQKDGTTFGGEGKYLKVNLYQSTSEANPEDLRLFKDRELYRIAIRFRNSKGQKSSPIWIMDFVSREGNLEGKYNQLKVELTSEFYVWLNDSSNFDSEDDKPVGYEILRADRQLSDRTIISQGFINPMVSNYSTTDKVVQYTQRKTAANDSDARKMPSLVRVFETESPVVGCKDYHELAWNSLDDSSSNDLGRGSDRECYKAAKSDNWRAQTFQFNRLMQMYSPEVSFSDIQPDSSHLLSVKGMHLENYTALWGTERHVITGIDDPESKFLSGLTKDTASTIQVIQGEAGFINDLGLFGPANSDSKTSYNQITRDFSGGFVVNNGVKEFVIFGTPEVTERGADFSTYNNNATLRYSNNLRTLLQDDFRNEGYTNGGAETQVIGCNSFGERCVTLVEGSSVPTSKSIEQIKSLTGISQNNGILLVELKRPDDQFYLGGMYGGNNYESKSVSTYIELGSYTDIGVNNVYIKSPGDTYVYDFKFVKLHKTDTDISDRTQTQLTEIVTFPVETSIDLKNRNDLSLEPWDNKFQPSYDEYSEYNKVYSQQPNLIQDTDPGFKFKQVSEYDTRVIASKEKIAGENIDSWTDYLENEQQDLDGKYGPINGVVNFRDEIFTFQDIGVARLSINPRVQTTGSDGLDVELGTGKVLHDYNYLTTTSGSVNKWGIQATEGGFYYFDLINKSIMFSNGQGVKNLSDEQGLHQFFVNNIDFEELISDLPAENAGISTGYNSVNKDVYFSFKKETNPFTIGFNEKTGSFVSFYDYIPPYYINKGTKMLTIGLTGDSIWEHFKGDSTSFYGAVFDSKIVFNVNSQAKSDSTYNNIAFKSEMVDKDGKEIPYNTIDSIRIYNEYQDSGTIPLVRGNNLTKRNRLWTAKIPRNAGTRDRIKSPWAFVELTITNEDGNKIILHDIIISYTQY